MLKLARGLPGGIIGKEITTFCLCWDKQDCSLEDRRGQLQRAFSVTRTVDFPFSFPVFPQHYFHFKLNFWRMNKIVMRDTRFPQR